MTGEDDTTNELHRMLSFYADDCSSPLGLQSGDITDQELLAMSTFKKNFEQFGPQRGRLNLSSAYRADPQSINKDTRFSGAFIIELPKEKIVTGVATQGFGGEWVTKYRMIFSPGNGDPLVSSEVRGISCGHTTHFALGKLDLLTVLPGET